ncbi:LAMI_0F02608g1_1 [Lachancea mirantina]|uniref:Ubiquinone biosynthesis monooxygenase COQ6, mitochondrial n=1 Tax=Lachancea mirantina TaxID=1230905 RepID=A0A1G4JWR7_9SACH|nr:LAMI_0F02608g1_1 [Lachancea mirantina]
MPSFKRISTLHAPRLTFNMMESKGSSCFSVIDQDSCKDEMILKSRRLFQVAGFASKAAPKLTDVLIVGGGPAGLTLAAAIQTSPHLAGLSTTLVDAGDLKTKVAGFYDNPPSKFTNRVISLTSQSKRFLEETVGVRLMEERVQAFDGIYVTDGCSNGKLEMERESMGSMVEILNIQSSVLARINELNAENLEIIDKAKVVEIQSSDLLKPGSWPIVSLDNGQTFKTRLLIGCDGFNSPVRKFSHIESRGWFYNRFGVVATMKLDSSPFKIRGWQKFLPTGPIAHLPLPDDNATLVWSTTEPLSKLLLDITPEQFTLLVNAAFVLDDADMKYYYEQLHKGSITTQELKDDIKFRTEQVLATMNEDAFMDEIFPPTVTSVEEKSRARFPLKLSHADTYVSERVALVGDAAHTTHPLAGQGLNMGQGDVESLVKALEKGIQRGQDIGSLLALEPYWSERYPYNNMLLGVVDKLHKVYSTDFGPIVAARTLGLNLIDKLGPLKDTMMRTVSGPSRHD